MWGSIGLAEIILDTTVATFFGKDGGGVFERGQGAFEVSKQ